MTMKNSSALQAMTAWRLLSEYDDFDVQPYFDTVARHLLNCHGPGALCLADQALIKMRVLGDADGYRLWQEVRMAMLDLQDEVEDTALEPVVVH